jgi:hypothetical protein
MHTQDKMKITTENKHMLRYPALSSMSIFDISFKTVVTYNGGDVRKF